MLSMATGTTPSIPDRTEPLIPLQALTSANQSRPMRSSALRLHPAQLFTLAAAAIVTVCATILHTHLFARNPELGAWGVTFDLAISIPLIYYIVIVRTGAARPITIAPVFVIGVALATRLIPLGQQDFVRELRWIAA